MPGDQTVLVTGGSGYLGGWCIVQLLQQGYRVRTTVRTPSREASVREKVGSQIDPGERLEVLTADLLEDQGWSEAVAGCTYVLHVASPFPPAQPKDPDELIVPAREGTLRVLNASLDGDVQRIVLTSSVAAVRNGTPEVRGRSLTEADWSDPDNLRLTPYTRSKTIAELAAWELMRERDAEQRLATVQPGAIIGPVLGDDRSYSLEVIERLLAGSMPGLPRLGFSFIDVRDVAALHIAAMTAPEAAGQRLIAASEFLWFSDVARILHERLGEDAGKVPTRTIPNFVLRAMALFDPAIRSVSGDLGKKTTFSLEGSERRTGWKPRPIEESIVDCARSLLAKAAAEASGSSVKTSA